jgi:predicted PurR-regulated permease PerM
VGSIVTIVILVAALYFGKELFVPLALAALFSFLLAPIVHGLERLRLGRIVAVVLTTLLVSAGIGALGWVVWRQTSDLADNVERYRANVERKLATLRGAGETPIAKIEKSIEEATQPREEGDGASTADRASGPSPSRPVPVDVVPRRPGFMTALRDLFGPLLAPLGTAAVVFVLTIFMLVYHEDVRDRLIRLVSHGQIVVTTQALAEASDRISRYLGTTLVVNALYGVPVGVGLWLLGVPNAVLWGLLATLLRFIPYLGPWIAASFPIVLSIAVFPDWWGTLRVALLFVGMEVIGNNVVEPWLYGRRTGLSPLAVIVAAVFWTWLWGVVGLFLAIPLTLILAVAGRYVPQLAFLNVLLGDEPGLGPQERFYQRLVAADADEASEVADEYLADHPVERFYDDVVLPALRAAKHDVVEGRLDPESMRFVRAATQDLIEEVSERHHGAPAAERRTAVEDPTAPEPASPYRGARVLFLPAGDETDALAGRMLAEVLRRDGIETRLMAGTSVTGEMAEAVRTERPHVVCVGGIPPYAILRARHLCKRLRAADGDTRIVVALWDPATDPARIEERMRSSCADRVAVTLEKAAEAVRALAADALAAQRAAGVRERSVS